MRVLLIDQDPELLQALQRVLLSLGQDVTVLAVDTVADGMKLIQRQGQADLVLLDLDETGGPNGFDGLALLRKRHPAQPVVVICDTERAADVVQAIDMGAMGYVSKRGQRDELRNALGVVMGGGVVMPPVMLGLVRSAGHDEPGDTVPSVMRLAGPDEGPAAAAPPAAWPATVADATDVALDDGGETRLGGLGDEPVPADAALLRRPPNFDGLGLTPRQTDVLALLLRGLPNKLIARELNLSVDTVKDHVAAVLRALGVSTRTQAVLAVSQLTIAANGGLPGWRKP